MSIDPEYFWYRMSESEVAALCEVHVEKNKAEWEKTRLISYYAASGMNKMPQIDKFMPFPWEKEEKAKNNIKPSKERMNQLMKAVYGNEL